MAVNVLSSLGYPSVGMHLFYSLVTLLLWLQAISKKVEEKSANASSPKKHKKYVAFKKNNQLLLQGEDCIICQSWIQCTCLC